MSNDDFYQNLCRYYHIIYPDWENSLNVQAEQLSSIIKSFEEQTSQTILDVSCGIGTQVIGLAQLGYNLTANDISEHMVARAKKECQIRQLDVKWNECDMCHLCEHITEQFDVVLCCDNSISHLMSDNLLETAFKQFHQLTKDEGMCLLSVRDWSDLLNTKEGIIPAEKRIINGNRYYYFQTWKRSERHLKVDMFLIKDAENLETIQFPRSHYLISNFEQICTLLNKAGFEQTFIDFNSYIQPVIVARKQ